MTATARLAEPSLATLTALATTDAAGAVTPASGANPVPTDPAQMASIIDSTTTPGYTYFCDAAPGSLSSAAVWRISRMSSAGVTQWADGNANFDKIADNRASLSYS